MLEYEGAQPAGALSVRESPPRADADAHAARSLTRPSAAPGGVSLVSESLSAALSLPARADYVFSNSRVAIPINLHGLADVSRALVGGRKLALRAR